jgi:hypothetical protein
MDERRMAGLRVDPAAIISMMLATGLVLVLLLRVADDHPGGARWLLELLRALADLVRAFWGGAAGPGRGA